MKRPVQPPSSSLRTCNSNKSWAASALMSKSTIPKTRVKPALNAECGSSKRVG